MAGQIVFCQKKIICETPKRFKLVEEGEANEILTSSKCSKRIDSIKDNQCN